MKPVMPKAGNWERLSDMPATDGMIAGFRFISPLGIRVISAIEMVDGPEGNLRPEYHISISDNGERIPLSLIEPVLKMFGAEKWDEDNHVHGGRARHYWCPVDKEPEVCPCKDNEKPTIEGDYIVRDE